MTMLLLFGAAVWLAGLALGWALCRAANRMISPPLPGETELRRKGDR
jgi:hypothetical protein